MRQRETHRSITVHFNDKQFTNPTIQFLTKETKEFESIAINGIKTREKRQHGNYTDLKIHPHSSIKAFENRKTNTNEPATIERG